VPQEFIALHNFCIPHGFIALQRFQSIQVTGSASIIPAAWLQALIGSRSWNKSMTPSQTGEP
jgi:hypothetical protein